MANPKSKLMALLHNEMQRREESETRYQLVVQETVQRDMQMAHLEAKLVNTVPTSKGFAYAQREEHIDEFLS